jgi:hypothetical protein
MLEMATAAALRSLDEREAAVDRDARNGNNSAAYSRASAEDGPTGDQVIEVTGLGSGPVRVSRRRV